MMPEVLFVRFTGPRAEHLAGYNIYTTSSKVRLLRLQSRSSYQASASHSSVLAGDSKLPAFCSDAR
eukprot:1884472-Pleurochrysis_carterae.AAC.1